MCAITKLKWSFISNINDWIDLKSRYAIIVYSCFAASVLATVCVYGCE